MGRARELFFKNRQTFEGFIGKIVSNRLNKNDKSWRFLEIFLPNNGIFPKFKIICMNKVKMIIMKEKFIHKDSKKY